MHESRKRRKTQNDLQKEVSSPGIKYDFRGKEHGSHQSKEIFETDRYNDAHLPSYCTVKSASKSYSEVESAQRSFAKDRRKTDKCRVSTCTAKVIGLLRNLNLTPPTYVTVRQLSLKPTRLPPFVLKRQNFASPNKAFSLY